MGSVLPNVTRSPCPKTLTLTDTGGGLEPLATQNPTAEHQGSNFAMCEAGMIREFGVEAVLVDSWDLRVKADSQLPTQQAFLLSRPGEGGGGGAVH